MRKLTRKEVSKLSTKEFIKEAGAPVKRLMQYVTPYKVRFIIGIVFGVLYGIFNAIMVFGMKFVFETVLPGDPDAPNKLEPIKVPLIKKEIPMPDVDLSSDQALWVVISVCGVIPVLIAIRGLLNYVNQYCMLWVGQKVLYDLRSTCFNRLMNQSLKFYSKEKTGELIQTVFNQTRMAASTGSDLAANLVKHPISILSMVIALFVLDWVFAVCALVVFPLCMVPVVQISKKVRKAGGREEEEAGAIMVTMQEAFSGIRVVKSHAREDYESKRFNSASKLLMQLIMRWRKAIIIVAPMVETVASFGIGAGLAYAWATDMPASKFLVLYAALIGIYPHVKALSQLQIMVQKTLVATTKVFSIIDKPLNIADKETAVDLKKCKGEIEFKDLSFSYIKDTPAVQGINFKIEQGKSYALVGESGSGKSTLFNLLLRFYDPNQGAILVDGVDIRDYTQQSLRDNIGIVNQDTFLFHDTIYNNIRYGNLKATKEDIYRAAEQAHAHEFILAQEKGYDTVIGDKGGNLSGGQQQRLTIARAFVRSAPILLLDEATSALDSKSEAHIHDAIDKLSQDRTVIAIAHRLSTILSADNIVMMKDSRILDIAPHAKLVKRCPDYKRLYDLQFQSQENAE